jgi:type I restriction enzyme M protein
MNGSPLFTGDAGSGESEIRRFILENDWLEALVALPEQLFYNTGIATYVWVLTNRKARERKGKVQLIDATSFWSPMRKSLGDKRREVLPEKAEEILRLLRSFDGGEFVKIFPTTHFGFRKITVERPLKLNFQASADRIARLEEERAFQSLAQSKKKGEAAAKELAEGRAFQDAIRGLLRSLPDILYKEREEFTAVLQSAARKAGLKLPAPIIKAIFSVLSERDETAAVCREKDGNPEPDPDLRDTESVPLMAGPDPADELGVPASVLAFFDREVKPHVPDAWIDTSRRDAKDALVGIIGYEINFNRYFYKYTPPRPLEEIEADIRAVEKDIIQMLAEITGPKSAG